MTGNRFDLPLRIILVRDSFRQARELLFWRKLPLTHSYRQATGLRVIACVSFVMVKVVSSALQCETVNACVFIDTKLHKEPANCQFKVGLGFIIGYSNA